MEEQELDSTYLSDGLQSLPRLPDQTSLLVALLISLINSRVDEGSVCLKEREENQGVKVKSLLGHHVIFEGRGGFIRESNELGFITVTSTSFWGSHGKRRRLNRFWEKGLHTWRRYFQLSPVLVHISFLRYSVSGHLDEVARLSNFLNGRGRHAIERPIYS
ncbi:hypothetical protein PIB30_028658 [Stylosanthes scabra]|uniref:Uncharacterized protein n=1 Tax=Stylosanthes scabra TaxID=79078 RepID=A0ABU6RBB6_9FABA|nr:hypothetical protein [Stylosanthes scabra]